MKHKAPRPRAGTVRHVILHMESIGLRVYGDAVDLQTGEKITGFVDYSAEDVIRYRRLAESDKIWRSK